MQETAPAAVICANINDWKFVYDHFGNEESDRLIKTVAGLIRKEAKEEYLIGRVDGDVFEIVIPTPEDGEAEAFCDRIQQACTNYEDPYLAPSLAIGLVYRTNVEESFDNVIPMRNMRCVTTSWMSSMQMAIRSAWSMD